VVAAERLYEMRGDVQVFNYPETGRGWGVYPGVRCPACGYTRTCVAPAGSQGAMCPACYHYEALAWLPPDDEQQDQKLNGVIL
jgi:hypothetical protein